MKLTMVKRWSLRSLGLAVLVATAAGAATPGVITYSGTLLDSNGVAATASTTITFRLYAQPSGGSPAWEDMVAITPDSAGWFAAQIGAATGNPLNPILFRQPLWLGLQVATDAQEMTPRVALTPAPYALSVDYGNVVGLPSSFPSTWGDIGGKPATFPAAWADVTGKPAVFPSDWASVASKPSTFPVDATAVQSRLTGTCPTSQYMRLVNQDGSVVCGTDANSGGTVTSVSATGTGNPISVTNGTTTPSLKFATCAAGQVLKYNATAGWVCASVSPIVVSVPGCGASCPETTAESFATITVNSISITTPGPGNIVVEFSGSAQCLPYSPQYVDLHGQLTNSATAQAVGYGEGGAMFRQTTPGTGMFSAVMSTHRTFAVASAGTFVYYYRANNSGTSSTVCRCIFYGANMTATYYPN